jgi:hypothetical protein
MTEHVLGAEGSPDGGLRLLERFCTHTARIVEQATGEGEPIHSVRVFERALTEIDFTREELLTLWVVLEGAVRATRKAANYAVEPESDAGDTSQ